MSKLITCIWFANNDGEEAAKYYIDTFNSAPGDHSAKMGDITKSPKAVEEASGRPEGSVLTAEYELDGISFMALNGGPDHKFTEAISFFVDCKTQEEVDELWNKLTEGGEEGPCGWLKDKFGLSWQIIPRVLGELLGDPDPAKSQSVMQAMLQMKKIDIKALQEAYKQAPVRSK